MTANKWCFDFRYPATTNVAELCKQRQPGKTPKNPTKSIPLLLKQVAQNWIWIWRSCRPWCNFPKWLQGQRITLIGTSVPRILALLRLGRHSLALNLPVQLCKNQPNTCIIFLNIVNSLRKKARPFFSIASKIARLKNSAEPGHLPRYSQISR